MANNSGFSDFDVDAQEIEQRRKYAEMLRQQSMDPVQSQMAGGWVIPTSPFQGAAKLLQAYSGRKGIEKADAEKKALAEALRNERMGTLAQFQSAMEGRLEEQGTDPTGGLSVNPGQAPNPKAAMMALALSRDPALSQAGVSATLAQATKTPDSAFAKVNPKDYTPESVQKFIATGAKDFSVLQPRDRLEFVNEGGVINPRNPYTAQPVGSPITKSVSPDAAMRQRWDEFTFGNISPYQNAQLANQRAGLQNDAAGLGMRRAELFYNTGMSPMGGGAVPPAPQGMQVPSMAPAVPGMPQSPGMQPAPAMRPQPMGQPVGGRPPAMQPAPNAQAAPPAVPGLSPRAQAERKAKMDEERPVADAALAAARAKAEVVTTKVAEALDNMKGLTGMSATGLTGAMTGVVPGTPAYQLERALDTIKANLGFQELAAMRAASPTGGALGSITERELAMLQSTVASLDRGQSEAQLKKNLEAVQKHFNNWRNAVEQSYAQKFGAPPKPPAPAEPGGAANVIDELLRKYGNPR
jgi:hypothetical protein